MITLTYDKLSQQKFQEVLRKIGAMEVPNRVASKIHYLLKGVNQGLKQVTMDYRLIIEAEFAERGDDNQVKRPESDLRDFVMKAGVEDKRREAEDAFAKKEFNFERDPLNQHDLSDVKLSAFDLEALGPLYQELPARPKVVESPIKIK